VECHRNPPRAGLKVAAPEAAASNSAPVLTDEMLAKLTAARTRVHESLGKIVLAMATTGRYRHIPLGDITSLVLDPLLRDRVALASPAKSDGTAIETDVAGIAFWASVSESVDAKIREQIKEGVFPVRLQAEDWTSGHINWLLDVIAPNAQLATAVVTNFKQVVKEGQLLVHPRVAAALDSNLLKRMEEGQNSTKGALAKIQVRKNNTNENLAVDNVHKNRR
jgi:cytolysin-activating lysine-acyltransferase